MADKAATTNGKSTATEKPTESKRDRFVRLAENRTGKALKSVLLIANLAGPGYEHTEADDKAIIGALKAAVARVEGALGKNTAPESDGFKLPPT